MSREIEIVLAALYLRGAPRPIDPPRRGWPQLVRILRREPLPLGSISSQLRAAGASLPATLLDDVKLLTWAEEIVEADATLSAVVDGYPTRWLEVLGDLAPPMLWRRGPLEPSRWLGAVGSREVPKTVESFMTAIGKQAVQLKYGVVSGGAVGCDSFAEQAALRAGGNVLRILPHGLAGRPDSDEATCLALAAPNEIFTRALAMERNALIYAAAEVTIVGHVRMRQGGTWHGATEALRKRTGRLFVRQDNSPAWKALQALGAEPIRQANELAAKLELPMHPRSLFAYEHRRRYRVEI